MKLPVILMALASVGSIVAQTAKADYAVAFAVGDDFDDTMSYIINYDSGEKIDSAIVADGVAKLTGKVDAPVLARIVVDGNRGPVFILENGDITIDAATKTATGTPLNTKLNGYVDGIHEIITTANNLPQDSVQAEKIAALEMQYDSMMAKAFEENASNPVGLYFFLQKAYDMDLAQLDEALAKTPALSASKRVQSLREALKAEDETSVGKKFKDFEVTYDGTTERLSNYVGKGKYVLVDFWASWCAPCMREIATLKQIRNEYGPKGLEILGVAVWDEPANTLKAIEQKQIPWHSMIDAQTIPTDIYGISGIPCIILFGPDGTILSRGLQGQQLINAVKEALDAAPTEN